MKLSDIPSYMRPAYNFPEEKTRSPTYSDIKIESPWKPLGKSFNPKTSYRGSFSPDSKRPNFLKYTGKQILNTAENIPGTQSVVLPKFNSKSKSLAQVTDLITHNSSNYGKKIAPIQINSTVNIDPAHFTDIVQHKSFSKISEENAKWLVDREKSNFANHYNKGEYIPSVSHMQLYGRKEPKSIFDKRELWKRVNLFS